MWAQVSSYLRVMANGVLIETDVGKIATIKGTNSSEIVGFLQVISDI